jgi:ABC-type phosphate/phosphonate transport system substrate-binding protein
MYDLPELVPAHEAWWQGLSKHFARKGFDGLPDRLEWPTDLFTVWRSSELFLSQTCGYPLKRILDGQVKLVGTPIYDAPGCTDFYYASTLIVRAGSDYRTMADLRGAIAAYNELGSQSGYNALRFAAAPLATGGRFFGSVVESGRHEASIDMVATGKADVAAIDSVTLKLLQLHQPWRTQGVRSIGETVPVAGLPLITSIGRTSDELHAMRAAIADAFADARLEGERKTLLLLGCGFPDEAVYEDVHRMEIVAERLGYSRIA